MQTITVREMLEALKNEEQPIVVVNAEAEEREEALDNLLFDLERGLIAPSNTVEVSQITAYVIHVKQSPETPPRTSHWPEPLDERPSEEELEEWLNDGVACATDGCVTEPDGECKHGHVSWFVYLGMI